jgi:hypothetical protein
MWRAKPFVRRAHCKIDLCRSQVNGDYARRLGRVHDEKCPGLPRQHPESVQIKQVASREMDVAHADRDGLPVHEPAKEVGWIVNIAAEGPGEPKLKTLFTRPVFPWANDTREVVGDDDYVVIGAGLQPVREIERDPRWRCPRTAI